MHYVTAVKHLGGHRLGIKFGDGSYKEVDLSSHLNGRIFEPLRDVEFFRRVQLNPDIDTICWENGADIAPDFLYQIGC